MGQSTEWITEDELATRLNVDRSVLRQRRPYLLAGEVEQKNGAVLWQKNAAARVAAELGLPMAEGEAEAPAPEPPPETLTVISQAVNRNIVNAQRASGEAVCVRVVDNRKYIPRLGNGQAMTLTAKKSTAGNWWVLVGREPRWPGIY